MFPACELFADDFIPRKQTSPPGPPLSPKEAIAKMTVPDGFHVELVASEPDLLNPVAMAFDDRGRIFVTESFEYPRHEPGPGRDRVKILEDTDQDGKVDSVKIFAEGLNIPSGIAVGHGGVWVANAPDILFLEDTDGDDKADKQTVVVTGFGRDDTHELPNALTWGPDGCLYGLNGVFNRSVVKQDGNVFDFTCAMFRIDPRTRKFDLFCEGTSNPWGIAFDPEGSAFISACVIDHLWHLSENAYYQRQGGPYPPHTWWVDSIVQHKHQMAAYCGIEYFDSAAYPAKYRDKLYMGNIHGGCLNSDRVERFGATYQGFPEPDFITANDVWFMPVAQKVGPDGCLYVLDWYDRYHCYQDASADPKGVDRGHGRLYRIVHDQRPKPKVADFGKLSDEQLATLLSDDNIFNRQRAQLELNERDPWGKNLAVSKQLESSVLDKSKSLKARMHSLWALAGSSKVNDAFCSRLLQSDTPELRAWGVRLTGNSINKLITPDSRNRLIAEVNELSSDPDPRVRLQVSVASTKVGSRAANVAAQLNVLAASTADPLLPRVVWRNLEPSVIDERDQIAEFLTDPKHANAPLVIDLAPRVVSRWIAEIRNDSDKVRNESLTQAALKLASHYQAAKPTVAADILERVITRLRNREIAVDTIRKTLSDWLAAGQTKDPTGFAIAWDPNTESPKNQWANTVFHLRVILGDLEENARVQQFLIDPKIDASIRRLLLLSAILVDTRAANSPLQQLLDDLANKKNVNAAYRDTVLDLGISRLPLSDIPSTLTKVEKLDSSLQTSIAERLCSRNEGAVEVLKRISQGTFRKELISPNRIRILASNGNSDIQKLVSDVWGTVNSNSSKDREDVINRVANQLRWDARGNAEKGWVVYDRICGQCHLMHGRGNEVGPNITANGRGSYDQLLVSVFNPSLVIGNAYKSVTIRTDDGTIVTGLLIDRNDQRTIVKVQGGKEQTILQSDIEEFRQDSKSLMPDGIENQMTAQELADLFALLTLESPPNSPTNAKIQGTPENLHSGGK